MIQRGKVGLVEFEYIGNAIIFIRVNCHLSSHVPTGAGLLQKDWWHSKRKSFKTPVKAFRLRISFYDCSNFPSTLQHMGCCAQHWEGSIKPHRRTDIYVRTSLNLHACVVIAISHFLLLLDSLIISNFLHTIAFTSMSLIELLQYYNIFIFTLFLPDTPPIS